jgi:hypothetical protein
VNMATNGGNSRQRVPLGDITNTNGQRYPPKDGTGVPRIANRVVAYLDHEMVTTIYL